MSPLSYARAASLAEARAALRADPGAEPLAGGTDLMQRIEEEAQPPARLVDIARVEGLTGVAPEDGAVRIGALTTLAVAAANPTLRDEFPALVEALEATASPQVRNLATVGGNPFQKTRCLYFRDRLSPCNRREPASGCSALGGCNRMNAILGGSEACIAVHPSDFAVAMVALDAEVEVEGPDGARSLPMADLHREPGETPHIEYAIDREEIVTGYRLPVRPLSRRSHYLKVRDRAEFEWALCSAAVALDLDGEGRVADARVAVGGVATKPWRLPQVEDALRGAEPGAEAFRAAAASAAEGAVGHGGNDFKIALLPRVVARALDELGESL